jgi:hypothetical protein
MAAAEEFDSAGAEAARLAKDWESSAQRWHEPNIIWTSAFAPSGGKVVMEPSVDLVMPK